MVLLLLVKLNWMSLANLAESFGGGADDIYYKLHDVFIVDIIEEDIDCYKFCMGSEKAMVCKLGVTKCMCGQNVI